MKYSEKIPDEVDKRILSLISHGFTHQEIANQIYRSIASVRKRLQTLKEYYNCKTIPQLIAHCTANELF